LQEKSCHVFAVAPVIR